MKTTSFFSKIMLLIAVLTMMTYSSCKKDKEEEPPIKEFVIAPNAKFIIDNDWQSMLINIDSTTYTFTFNQALLNNYSLKQGDLIVSAVGNGLLRKIECKYRLKTAQDYG